MAEAQAPILFDLVGQRHPMHRQREVDILQLALRAPANALRVRCHRATTLRAFRHRKLCPLFGFKSLIYAFQEAHPHGYRTAAMEPCLAKG